jgi:hypothetical protein
MKLNPKLSLLINLTKAMCNLCKRLRKEDFELVSPFVEIFLAFIDFNDRFVISNVLMGFAYLTEICDAVLYKVASRLPLGKILVLCKINDTSILKGFFKLMGNICAGPDETVDLLIKNHNIGFFNPFISAETDRSLFDQICFVLRNIASGASHHREALITSGILDRLCTFINSPDTDRMVNS